MITKKKICKKGTGKASGFVGCGKEKYIHRYGLCKDCFFDWLYGTESGKEYLNSTRIKAHNKVEKETEKENARIKREQREKIIDYKKKLQDEIQKIARLIDLGQPCLARGIHPNQMHGGHVFSKGSHSNMRFNLHNIHRQSAQSNHFQNEDGLLREGLIKEYGMEYFDYLNSLRSTPTLHYSNEEYKSFYRKACKITRRLMREGHTFDKVGRLEMRNKINAELGIYENVEYKL